MEQNKLDYYRERLEKEKVDLIREIKHLNDEEEQNLKDSTGELSSYDNHPADQGGNTLEREMDLGLKDNNQGLLEKVDNALDCIKKGKYGYCQECGAEINHERLETIPYTGVCKECSSRQDELEVKRERPLEEESIGSPFSGSFTDDEEDIAYDGEDAWEDVAKYGTSNTTSDDVIRDNE